MARTPRAQLAFLSALLLAGCKSGGDYREITFSADLTPGDVAHYCEERGSLNSSAKLEDVTIGFPLFFVPAVLLHREAEADPVIPDAPIDCERYHYHFEEFSAFLLFLAQAGATANFDQHGRNLSWQKERGFLLYLISSSVGQQRREDGTLADTSSFSILWGLFSTARTAHGRNRTIFWFPMNTTGEIQPAVATR